MPWLSCSKVYNDVVADDAMLQAMILGNCSECHRLSDLQTHLQMHYPDSHAADMGAVFFVKHIAVTSLSACQQCCSLNMQDQAHTCTCVPSSFAVMPCWMELVDDTASGVVIC
jgi:hypothetical protein